MERTRRSLNRSKADGTKFVFKLSFQATRIPNSGWEKLVLSLQSLETGIILATTPKSLVHNGTCQWPDPIIESTRLVSDPSTGEYADKLYKIVIQMVSVRVGILGEATIDLSDYTNAESTESIWLPLENCNSGSFLHVKVQCLTPRSGFRETKDQRTGSYEQEYAGSVSEDNSSNSDVSENLTTGSVGSSSSQTMSVRTHVSHQTKRGTTWNLFLKDGSSSMDTSLHGIDGSNGHLNSHIAMQNGSRSLKSLSQKLESAETTIQELREEVSKWERQARKLSADMGILKQQLTAESKNGADLKVEILAKKAECDSLRSELEQKKISKVASKDNYSRWEMDDSKWQINMLQEQVAYQKELNADLHLQLSKMHDSNGELVAVVKDLEDSLDAKTTEVDKLKEVNKELLEELSKCHDLTESHGVIIDNTEDKQIKDKLKLKKKLKEKDLEIKRQMSKLRSIEGGPRKTQAKGENSDELLKTIEILRKKMEEQEMDCKELTDENIELHYRLNKASKDLESKIVIISELQRAHAGSISDVLQDSFGSKSPGRRDSIIKLELQVEEINMQKQSLEELVCTLEREKRDLELRCEVLSEQRDRQEATNIEASKHHDGMKVDASKNVPEIDKLLLQLEDNDADKKNLEELLSETSGNNTLLNEKLQELTQDLAESQANIKQLEALLSDSNSCKVSLEMKIEDMIQESANNVSKMEMEKADLQKKLDETQYDIETAKERLDQLLQDLEASRNTVDALSDAKITSEKTVLKLVDEQKEMEAQILQLEKINLELSERRSILDTQVRNVSEERDCYRQQLEIANIKNLQYQNAVKDLGSHQSLLEQKLRDKTSEYILMQEKLVTAEAQMTQKQQEFDINEQAQRIEIQSLLSQKENAEHRVIRAEEEFLLLQKNKDDELTHLESKIEQLTLAMNEKEKLYLVAVTELCAEKTAMEFSLRHMVKKLQDLESELSTLHKNSGTRIDEMVRKLDASLTSCDNLKQKLKLLRGQLENQEKEKIEIVEKVEILENELKHKVDALSEIEQRLLNAEVLAGNTIELQERCQQLEDDAKASKELLIIREKEFAQKESDLCQRIGSLEMINEQLENGIDDSEADQLKHELIRLQTQNSCLSRREQELLSAMHTQEVLEEEVKRLQESNDLVEARLSKFIETAKSPFLLEKLVTLETELAEAVEANNMYKEQLRSILEEHQNDLDEAMNCKKEIVELKEQLRVMHERYSLVSLQLAESEAEKGELQMRMRREFR